MTHEARRVGWPAPRSARGAARVLLIAAFALLLAWSLPVEAAPHGLAVPNLAAAGGEHRLLAIADLRGHALLLLDPAAPEAARRIPLPGGPHELVLLPDGRVAASLEQSGVLAVVDIASGAVEVVSLGGVPHGLALHDGVLHVTDREHGTVRRLRLDGWGEESAVEAGTWPHAVAVLPDGGLAVADAATSTLRIGGRALATSELPETVAVSPDGTRIATAGALGDSVEVFDRAGVLLMRAAVGGRPVRVAFSPAGDQLAVALSALGAVALIDGQGGVRRVEVGGLPDGLRYDGTTLYAGDLSAGRLTAIDAPAARVTEVLRAGAEVRSTGTMLVLAHRGAVAGLVCPLVRQ